MRDDSNDTPIPDKFEISQYYVEALADKRALVELLEKLTDAEWQERLDSDYDESVKSYEQRVVDNLQLRSRYQEMLGQVQEWTPPTSEHEGLKTFMIEQIEDSMKFDCYEPIRPEKLALEEFKTEQLQSAKRSLGYSQENLQEEIDRVNGRNKWIQALRDSVPPQ
jgi:hypothetical protein